LRISPPISVSADIFSFGVLSVEKYKRLTRSNQAKFRDEIEMVCAMVREHMHDLTRRQLELRNILRHRNRCRNIHLSSTKHVAEDSRQSDAPWFDVKRIHCAPVSLILKVPGAAGGCLLALEIRSVGWPVHGLPTIARVLLQAHRLAVTVKRCRLCLRDSWRGSCPGRKRLSVHRIGEGRPLRKIGTDLGKPVLNRSADHIMVIRHFPRPLVRFHDAAIVTGTRLFPLCLNATCDEYSF